MTKYPIEVFWSDEDKGYIATFPDLPGCSAWGTTEAEANYSGRFLMRESCYLHAELARHAKRQGISLNQYVLYMLAARQGVHHAT
jgi:predicted HicB family RNase H-like nuclease